MHTRGTLISNFPTFAHFRTSGGTSAAPLPGRSTLKSRFLVSGLILVLGLDFLWGGQTEAQEYCWNNSCFDSLTQAENALRDSVGVAGQYLEAYRSDPQNQSPYTFRTYYAMDIKPVESPLSYAFDSYSPPGNPCVNAYPTPDHGEDCNSLNEAAAKADEYHYQHYDMCFSKTTPHAFDYHQRPVGGAPWQGSRTWFAAFWNKPESQVIISAFVNPTTRIYTLKSESCAVEHSFSTDHGIRIMEASLCPDGMWDTYANQSPVSGNIRRVYPYECWNSASGFIESKKPLPNASCGMGEGNPCDPLTGNKRISKTDFEHKSLPVSRHYHSLRFVQSIEDVGRGWTHNYSSMVKSESGGVLAYMPDGSITKFEQSADKAIYMSQQKTNVLLYVTSTTEAELRFDSGDSWKYQGSSLSNGLRLVSKRFASDASRNVTLMRDHTGMVTDVIDQSGRSLHFDYQDDQLVSIALPDGNNIRYFYEDVGFSDTQRLIRVEYQDATSVEYRYTDDRHPYHVTAIMDELGNTYATYAYDHTGRVISSEHAGGAGRVELSYSGLNTTVTTPMGDSRVYFGTTFGGNYGNKYPSYNRIEDGTGSKNVTWRSALPRRKESVVDQQGNRTRFQYDAWSRTTSVREAVGTPEETEKITVWDNSHNRISERRQAGSTTSYRYNSRAQVLTRSVTDTATQATRTWTYTYFEPPSAGPLIGQVRTIDGPRTDAADITTYEYYTSDHPGGEFLVGDLKFVVNALGHRTDYLRYDFAGRPLEIRDANNVLTVLTYHPRGWINSHSVNGGTTSFNYDSAGNLTRVTQPDGSSVEYGYDDAHRLNAIADNFNNRVEFTLDAEGNRTAEKTHDENGVLRRQLGRVYTTLNRLDKLIDGNQEETQYSYDNNGNRTGTLDANHNAASFAYDGLNRLTRTIDAALGETRMSYDDRDNLISVTDPLGNSTEYTYDGLDNQTQLASPDSGTTRYEYDDAGNRTASTDARGVRTEYFYDALNRLTEISYADAALDVRYTYDAGSNGKGRLTGIEDALGTVDYTYDARGNLLATTRTIGEDQYITSFSYNSADRLTGMTYPSGMVVEYTLDAAGRITAVDRAVDSTTEILASHVTYEPFGPVMSFTYGNGLTYSATYDQDYELAQLQSGPGWDQVLGRDPAGNILSLDDQLSPSLSQTFTYDELYRLDTAQGGYGSEGFAHDANGNRLRTLGGTDDSVYTYEAGSNRLEAMAGWQFSRDAAGNRTGKLDTRGYGQLYSYADHNRLVQALVRDGAGDTLVGQYGFDGLGQRILKTASGETVHFVYGPSGELLGEYPEGSMEALREYVYLNGQPIAIRDKHLEDTPQKGRELIIDNGDPGTSSTGKWQTKKSRKGIGANYLIAKKSEKTTYRWSANLAGGNFQVYAWWVDDKKHADSVTYTIGFGDGKTDTLMRSHKSGGGQWQLLGSYHSTGDLDYVEVSSDSKKFVADAIRWVETPGSAVALTDTTQYIHFDHLGTPRRVSDDTGTIVWAWDSRPFGVSEPDQDPDRDSQSYSLNLRFPGQYYDAETGLHYNYYRTYDPDTGRYIESDPIGLRGGLNTFGYVSANPMKFVDPTGLVIRGSWIESPKANITNYGLSGVDVISPYFDKWGYLKSLRISGYVAGFVNLDVKCSDSNGCESQDWEIHEQLLFSFSGGKDVGPNAIAAGTGSLAGPLAGAVTGIFTFGAASLSALLNLLQEGKSLGVDKAQWLYEIGPDVICMGLR